MGQVYGHGGLPSKVDEDAGRLTTVVDVRFPAVVVTMGRYAVFLPSSRADRELFFQVRERFEAVAEANDSDGRQSRKPIEYRSHPWPARPNFVMDR